MPIAETGGWDLVIEISPEGIRRYASSFVPQSTLSSRISTSILSGTITAKPALSRVELADQGGVAMIFSTGGSTLRVDDLTAPTPGVEDPPPSWLATIDLPGEVRVTDRLELRGRDLVLDLGSDAQRKQPQVEVAFDEDALMSAPLVQLLLAKVYLDGGESAYTAAREQLLDSVQTQIAQQISAAVKAIGAITLVEAPVKDIRDSELVTQRHSLHLCYSLGERRGFAGSITRSMLLESSAGITVDLAALAIANEAILRNFVTPALARALNLPGHRFAAPCRLLEPAFVDLDLGDSLEDPVIESLIAGIDEFGRLRIRFRFAVSGTAGAFTISASVDLPLSIHAGMRGNTLAIQLKAGDPDVASDVSIAWWAYAVGALGGSSVTSSLAFADLMLGNHLNALLATMIKEMAGAFPRIVVPLPAARPPVRVRGTTSFEEDAPRRTLNPPIPSRLDPFRAHDVIVNFI